jgi:muconate cycloisomerase
VDLNGPQFIAEDYLKTPFPIERQNALVPRGPGLGIEIDEAKVKEFAL